MLTRLRLSNEDCEMVYYRLVWSGSIMPNANEENRLDPV